MNDAVKGGANERLGLPPVAGPDARMLILGSMPGNLSLERGQYYAHPRNQFWPIMSALFGIAGAYEDRLRQIRERRIALWDVLDRCERPGSLDSAIRDATANDFALFLTRHSAIEAVFFNGGKAGALWKRNVVGHQPLRLVGRSAVLPSTSPAHAAMSLAGKVEAWRSALAD